MRLLDNINYPKEIRELSIDQLDTLCGEIREYMIECCAKNPGHLGASLGAVELAVGIHYVFNTPTDKLVWDVGHQAYAHKILTGRKEAFKNNRKLNGLSGFTKRAESEYDPFGAGHTSTSISGALGIAVGEQLRGLHNHIIAVIGDGALSGGLAYEALNNAGSMNSDILVILNDNQISIDKNVGAMHNYLVKLSTSPLYNRIKNRVWNRLSNGRVRRLIQKFWITTKSALLKNGTLFASMGFRYFGTIDGNDIGQLVTTLSNIKDIRGPKILHVRTVKGKGYKPAEQNQTVWHAPGIFDIKTGERVKSSDCRLKYQEVFGNTIIDLAKSNPNIVGITPAMASGCSMTRMMETLPNRSFDVGIAEEHAVTFAAGLAAAGILPFCNIYSTFLQRAYDNIVHDVALQNLKVIFCIDRAGLVGEDGATHHGSFDLAYLRPIPNITIAAPMNEVELQNIMYSATQEQYGATAIRYPRGKCEGLPLPGEYTYIEPGKGRELLHGKQIAILSLGTTGNRVTRAIEQLKEQGITPGHYDMRFLKPLDTELLDKVLNNYDKIITIEDGVTKGGLYGAVCEYAAAKRPLKIIAMGIPDKFIEQGTIDELTTICKYNVEEIAALLKEEWEKQ